MREGDIEIRAVWEPRGEGRADAAPRLRQFLTGLRSVCDDLGRWGVLVGRGAKARLQEVALTDEALRAMADATMRLPGGGARPESLGASVALFAISSSFVDRSPSVAGQVGVLENPSGFRNTLALSIPLGEKTLRRAETIEAIMELAIQAWTPQWVCAYSEDHFRRATNWSGVLAGWKIWVAGSGALHAPLPDGVGRRAFATGVLITSVPHDFDHNNPEDVQIADAVQDALIEAGLVPTPTQNS